MLDEYKRALAASEARFRDLIEKNADGVIVVRDTGMICYVNPAAEALLGRRAGELVGEMFGRPVVPGSTAEIDLCPARLARGAHSPHPVLRAPQGVVAEMRAAEIEWDGQSAFLATLRDITERKRADAALRFLADASTALAGSLDSATTLANVARLAVQHLADWCILDVLENPRTIRRLAADHGDAVREELARRLCGAYAFAPESPGVLADVLRGGRPQVHADVSPDLLRTLALGPGQEAVFRQLGCKAVMIVPMAARGRLIGAITFVAADTGRVYGPSEQALATDLANRAAVAMDNAQLYDQAQEAVRRRDEFLAMLAHELRNPLAPILNAAQVLRWHGLPTGELERFRAVIERQGQHLARLLDDLLDLSRVTHGKIELRKQVVDLGAVVADAVQSSRPLIEARRQHLAITLEEKPLRVEGDPTRLSQIVINLLNNAAKYTDPGGRIELSAHGRDGYAVLRVKDTGIGIPPAQLSSIFEPFTQLSPSVDRSQGGLGIGLALVRSLVRLHGGTIEARSEGPGRGSEFLLRLPLDSRPATMPAARPAADRVPRRVLLIEDNRDGREMLADLLRLWGHQIEEAPDGLRGLESIRRQPPDVALVDVGLPGLDGYELARQVRTLPGGKEVFLIAVTGYGRSEDRRRALDAGFDAHLVKPVDLDQLARLLAEQRS